MSGAGWRTDGEKPSLGEERWQGNEYSIDNSFGSMVNVDIVEDSERKTRKVDAAALQKQTERDWDKTIVAISQQQPERAPDDDGITKK